MASAAGRVALPRIYGTDIKERPSRNRERTVFSASSEVGSWLRQQEPVPLLAKRGQCTVMTTALLHSAWLNSDTHPRKGIHYHNYTFTTSIVCDLLHIRIQSYMLCWRRNAFRVDCRWRVCRTAEKPGR